MINPDDPDVTRVSSHRKVIIYREYIYTPNLKELPNGSIKELKPKVTRYYGFANSYRYSSIDEAKADIDLLITQAAKRNISEASMIETLNDKSS